jgi:gliding motility-associated-like protein/uncharacterized repeat protein (TIGR01451 family)
VCSSDLAGVTHPEYVIDDDENSFSEISVGLVGVLASMEQNVYFPAPYTPTDEFSVTLKTDPTLITLGLLNKVSVSAYNGATEVYETDIYSILNIDLLTLLQNGEKAKVIFTPGVSFDRVKIKLSSLLGVNITQYLDVYDISVVGPPPPTTIDDTQEFCLVDEPTIADIQVNEANVIWYDAQTGGNPYDPTDSLTDGLTYYASQLLNGCESEERLEVTVNVNDTDTPTTDNTEQGFCAVDNPTVADLQADGPNIVWYDAPENGTPYDPSDPLVDGQIYYAAATGPSGCESSVRLAVTVTIGTGSNPTITSDASGTVCLNTMVTYTTESGNANYIWGFTGGTLIDGGGPDDNFISIQWTSIENTTVSVSYDPLVPCATGDTVTFDETVEVCADITITKTVDNPEPMVGENVVFTIEVNNQGPNDFTNLKISEQIPSGYDLVDFETTIGTYVPSTGIWTIDLLPANETAKLIITAEVLGHGYYLNIATIVNSTPIDANTSNNIAEVGVEPTCLFVYNEFSPNDDGVNDFFVITCIENYPNNSLKIFNRYGSLVYEKRGYDNTWDGRANVSNVSGKTDVLPSDTYYYVLELGDGGKPKMGWLFLIK